MISLETAVQAFVDSIAHVFGVESGSNTTRIGAVHMIHHPLDVFHHYPREFSFRREFVALNARPEEAVTGIRGSLSRPSEDHVLYAFSPDISDEIEIYESLGYEHAWNNGLLAVRIDEARLPLARQFFPIRELGEMADVAQYEQLEGTVGVAHTLFDPCIHSFVSYDDDGEPIGRSQIITKVPDVAYVSGMFTAPDHRRRGVGSGLMNAMHARARREGAVYCVLIPSRMATESGFYPRFGYELIAPHAVFVPAIVD